MRNIHAFTTLFTIMNVALLWLTIIGVSYSKNGNNCVAKFFKITYSKRVSKNCKDNKNANYKRFLSLFNTGLLLFNLATDSPHFFNLRFDFHLYDI